jgi:3-deoxy-manno-octulosonate cytidylyltransferase (CMP-KDO synthetase)
MADNDVLIVIPARMASTRLPGKPLADIAGEPMIVHVMRRAQAANVGDVVVATDSEAIATCVEKAGGRAVMTRADHVSGSDRIFEALGSADPTGRCGIVVNVQGDLPTLSPADIGAAVELLDDTSVDIGTLAAELGSGEDCDNPNIVKVAGRRVARRHISARTFTRSISPAIWDMQNKVRERELAPTIGLIMNFARPTFYHHIGLYAYRRVALASFVKLPPSKNELLENLEQLRAMDNGMRIDVAIVDSVPLGVDTPEQLEMARALLGG